MTRILVVDDEEDIRAVLGRLLVRGLDGASRVEVADAPDVRSALALLEASTFDLVLSDFRMPGQTGAELLATVHERWPATRRVLMSGYQGEIHDYNEGVAGVVEAFVAKPWTNEGLLATLRGLLVLDGDAAP